METLQGRRIPTGAFSSEEPTYCRGWMVVDGTKGKLTQLYACSDREATEGWGVIRQLLELTLPRTFLQQLQSALEARLEARQGDARGR
jgi:hypothetical protein